MHLRRDVLKMHMEVLSVKHGERPITLSKFGLKDMP